jgi:SAM-dependent methyltransferase
MDFSGKQCVTDSRWFQCPFCGHASQTWGVVGVDAEVLRERMVVGAGRRAVECERCGSWDRDRLVYIYLRDYLKWFDTAEGKRVLHIAPEKTLAMKIEKSGVSEYLRGDLLECEYGYPANVAKLDIMDSRLPADHFDLVICNHVLEHVADDIMAMREIHRLLKPDGLAILQVPMSPLLKETDQETLELDADERLKRFGQYDHRRLYGSDYPSRLEGVGFAVECLNIHDKYAKYRINELEVVFVARRRSAER